MAITGIQITDKVAGDALRIQRTYTDLPTGITFSKIYLTVKRRKTDPDSAKVLQKSITTSAGVDGQITDATTTGGSIAFFFDLSTTETDDLTPGTTFYGDFQGITDDSPGRPYTFELFEIRMLQGQTDATT